MGASVIFYFSGSGNSYAAARQLWEATGSTRLCSMADPVPGEAVGGKGEAVGFVFPVYYGMLPRVVARFVDALDIQPETYCFAVVTMGGAGGGTVKILAERLAQKGVKLSYGRGVRMPGNYVVEYNPSGPEGAAKTIARAKAVVEGIAGDVRARVQRPLRGIKFTSRKLYRNIEALDEAFRAEEACDGCGLCRRVCPVENIRIVEGKPQWQHRCEHCMACIHWCPRAAIQYGERTKGRRRYHHPQVTALDLIRRD